MAFAALVRRHAAVGLASAVAWAVFWFGRLEWDPEMRLWRAFGDASFLLLIAALCAGPLARLWRPARRFLLWRRALGIWFALLALVHSALTLSGWVRWDWMRFWGYEFIPQANRLVRIEPGFGIANLTGVVALFWTLVLAATSSDRAVRLLGGSAWKWLHGGAYTVFYLVALHAAYFLFLHYLFSFHRAVPPPNWFRFPFLALLALVPCLQLAAFLKTRARAAPPAPEGGDGVPPLPSGSAAAVPPRPTRRQPRERPGSARRGG